MSDRLLKRADVAAATGRAGAVALLAALCAWAGQADAALSQPTAWTQEYANASFPTGNVGTLTIAAGTNRLLLVAITTSASSAGSETLTVSYGGQALTLANGDASGNNQMHTFFYYLKDAGITAATSTNLSVNITSSASPVYTWVYAGVFAGVNQTTPFTNTQNWNDGTTANTPVGPFATGLSMNANDWPIEAILLQRSSAGTTARTITTWAANWGTSTGATIPVNISFNDGNFMPQMYITHRAVPTGTVTDTSQHTASNSALSSMTGISLQAAAANTISIAQVTDPSNSASSTQTAAIDAFSLATNTGTATLSTASVTLTNPTALSGVFLYSNSACTGGTQYGTTQTPATSVSFSTANIPVTATATTFYVCGTAASVAASTSVTAVVASGTTTTTGYAVTASTDTAGTLTVLPYVTIGNGSAEPANSSITSGAVGPIDAFTVQSSGGTATITAIGVSLTFSAGTPLANVFVNSTSACTGTTYGTLASPVAGANTIPLSTSLNATTTASGNLYLCGTAATVAANATVTGTLSSVTATGYGYVDSDTTSATLTVTPPPVITIGNGSAEPANSSKYSAQVGAIDAFTLQTSAGTATVTAIGVSLTFSAGTPLTNVFVNSTSACTGTTYGTLSSPVSGANTIPLSTSLSATTTLSANYYVCGTAASVAANATVTGTLSSVTATGYTFTDNDTTSATLTVTPPPTITIGNGTAEPANSSITSGAVGAIDAFSLQTNSGTATVTAIGVSVTFSAGTPLTNLFVNSASACNGTTYGTLASPVSGANTISLTTSLSATTTLSANYYLCGTAATVSSSATVTGTLSSVTATGYVYTDNDTTSATLTVTPPPVPGTTTGAISATVNACNLVTVSVGYTGDTDGDNTVTFARSPDGVTYTALTACTSVGGGANPRTCADSTVAASTNYWYQATFTDATGGVTGTNPVKMSASVNTGACAPNLILAAGTQPAAGTLTVGATTWSAVGQFTLASSSGTVTLSSVALVNAGAATQATGSDLTLNLVNSAGTGVYSTGTWDGTKWVFGAISDPVTGLPISIGTTATTFNVYATANYGAAAGETLAAQVTAANVVGQAPATATTGTSVTGNTFTTAAPTAVSEGSLTSTTGAMISIVNPDRGKTVSGSFLAQIYVYSANGSAVTAMGLTTDGSTPACTANDATITKDSHSYTTAGAAMYSKLLSGLAAGTYTLKACATNSAGTLVSAPVTVTVRATGAGDGTLLVRDNSSQLCSDCHDQNKIKTHSSESTASKYGTWSANCRDCHTPHSTRNLYLVKEQIVPPAVNGYQASKNVYLATKTGDSNVSGATTPVSSSFVNTDASGVCQACHTRTMNSARTFTNGSYTNASTAVTTASAVFVSGNTPAGDVGNWIVAPDGRTYQIATVVSTTSVTLASPYQGATVTGAKLTVGPARWRNTGNQDSHYTATAGTAACTGCHSHSKGFAGGESSGGSNCSGCHGAIWNAMTGTNTSKHSLGSTVGTNDSFKDDATVNWGTAASLNAILPAQRSCVNMCHDDHVHDLSPATTHEQNAYTDSRNSTARAMTRDGSGNVTAGTPAKVDFAYNATTQAWGGMCTSCHQTQADASRPAIPAASFSGSGHDGITSSDGTSTYAWNYSLHDGSAFNRNCTKCHASRTEGTTPGFAAAGSNAVAVHGSNDASLLSGGKAVQNAATVPFVCWNCHGSTASPAAGAQGNRSNKNVQAVITPTKAYGHPLATTDSLHNSVTEASATWNGGQFSGTNRHVNCLDCHDPHAAGKTLHANGTNAVAAANPLAGGSGVGFTSPTTSWATTTSTNFTWKNGSTTAVAAEYEVCLKCHSSFAFGTTPPTGTLGSSSTAVETDQSQEFSTSNQSYHPVAGALPATDPGANGSSQLTAAQLCTSTTCTTAAGYPAGTQNWTPGQTMYCSDCHGNETASPAVQGPHGSAVKFVLKGPNNCWPYTWSGTGTACTTTLQGLGTNPTTNAFLNGNFCKNCHPLFLGGANSATTWSGNVVHYNHSGPQVSNTLCVNCHILVPHGGKVSRLIATATAGLPARYQVSGSTPLVTQFLKASGPGTYNTPNCNTTCSGHGAVTNPETW